MKFLLLIASVSVVVLAASIDAYTPGQGRYYPGEQRRAQPHPTPAAYRTPPQQQPSYRSLEQTSAPATVVRNFIKYNRLFLNKRELQIIFASIS